MCANPRHEGKGVDGDAIGTHGEIASTVVRKRLAGLQRQAVDQIDVDRRKSEPRARARRARASALDRCTRLTACCTAGAKSCTPIDRRLKPRWRSRSELLTGGHARVDFDGHLAVGVDVEMRGDRLVKVRHLRPGSDRWACRRPSGTARRADAPRARRRAWRTRASGSRDSCAATSCFFVMTTMHPQNVQRSSQNGRCR